MIIRNYINKKDLKILLNYAIELYKPKSEVVFIPSSQYRKRETIFNIPNEIYKIKNKIIKNFEIENYQHTADIFFNALFKNQKVSKHAHKKHENKHDLRFNIMLQNSDSGGVPECDGLRYYPKNGDMWIFNGCRDHETDLILGETVRYIISYGFIVEENIIDNIIKRKPIYL